MRGGFKRGGGNRPPNALDTRDLAPKLRYSIPHTYATEDHVQHEAYLFLFLAFTSVPTEPSVRGGERSPYKSKQCPQERELL